MVWSYVLGACAVWYLGWVRLVRWRARPILNDPAPWIRARSDGFRRALSRRLGVLNSVNPAVNRILQCIGEPGGLRVLPGPSSTGLMRGRFARRHYLRLSEKPQRPMFVVVLHEMEHHRFAIDCQRETGVDLMLWDALRIIPVSWEITLEVAVRWRTDPRLHPVTPFFLLESLLLVPGFTLFLAATRFCGRKRRRLWRCLARQERVLRRWPR